MGYHSKQIAKGTLGRVSKITEEHEELLDAHAQGNRVLEICELADLVGAIEAYVSTYNLTIIDLVSMAHATKRAFEAGERS
jgi:phosphoribosyl-ATP pyrophosphohydrolase